MDNQMAGKLITGVFPIILASRWHQYCTEQYSRKASAMGPARARAIARTILPNKVLDVINASIFCCIPYYGEHILHTLGWWACAMNMYKLISCNTGVCVCYEQVSHTTGGCVGAMSKSHTLLVGVCVLWISLTHHWCVCAMSKSHTLLVGVCVLWKSLTPLVGGCAKNKSHTALVGGCAMNKSHTPLVGGCAMNKSHTTGGWVC